MTWFRNSVVATILLSQVACGTLLYPDRQGAKHSNKLDPTVLILDGIGLFFFLVPGVIAFAVDIGTGAIYLPEDSSTGQSDVLFSDKRLPRVVNLGDKLDAEAVNELVFEKTGLTDVLTHADLLVQRIQPSELHQIMDLYLDRPLPSLDPEVY